MLEAGVSYAIISTSDMLKAIISAYIIELNRRENIFVGGNLYGKSLVISDTAEPTSRSIVLSKVQRQSKAFKHIDIDPNIVELTFAMHGIDKEQYKDKIRLIKQKTKHTNPELCYYKVCAIMGAEEISTDTIESALNLNYKGVHTTAEQIEVLVEFISNSSEINLQRVVKVFNEQDGGYQKLINCMSMLTNDTPEWISAKYKQTLESANFIKALLKIALIVLKAPSRDDFVLDIMKSIIYK